MAKNGNAASPPIHISLCLRVFVRTKTSALTILPDLETKFPTFEDKLKTRKEGRSVRKRWAASGPAVLDCGDEACRGFLSRHRPLSMFRQPELCGKEAPPTRCLPHPCRCRTKANAFAVSDTGVRWSGFDRTDPIGCVKTRPPHRPLPECLPGLPSPSPTFMTAGLSDTESANLYG